MMSKKHNKKLGSKPNPMTSQGVANLNNLGPKKQNNAERELAKEVDSYKGDRAFPVCMYPDSIFSLENER
jgi:hypothetical protein